MQETNNVRPPFPALLYGVLAVLTGLAVYLSGVILAAGLAALRLGGIETPLTAVSQWLVWYSGMPVVAGLALIVIDLFLLLPGKRREGPVPCEPPDSRLLTVALTAYNDEESIGPAVEDFAGHPLVRRVIVFENNSRDRTAEVAREAGAEVVTVEKPGYGQCVFRALTDSAAYDDTELVLLCEGDMTFRAYDIDKFMAYIPHAEIVNGTRIVEQLRARETQLTTFMYYGNFFVGKLLEVKHIGLGTFTDVGTTYKLCRSDTLKRRLLPYLDPTVNLEFNAHFLDIALTRRLRLVECPITFFERVGVSKGGNVSDVRALKVGMRMMIGLLLGWRFVRGG